jgi:3-oxoacyl-[acyl-carrier protein] reductase
MRNEVAYGAAKAGLIGLTKSLALDEAKNAITVNAVSPGWIATDSQTEDEKKQGTKTPLGRSASANEVAALVAWLSTSEASYITGQNIIVDGGNSIAEERN